MPLVRIDAPTADRDLLTALGDAVHRAMIDAFAIPADDRFQVLRGASDSQLVIFDPGYLGVRRDDVVFVQVFLRAGRADDQKRHFYRQLAGHLAAAGVEPRNAVVVLAENGSADWSFGDGVAQYLDQLAPR